MFFGYAFEEGQGTWK